MSKKKINLNAGHHKRLKESIYKNLFFATESHILEAILTYLYLRKDTKPIAKLILHNTSLHTLFTKKEFTEYTDSLQEYLLFLSTIRESFIKSLPKIPEDTSINKHTQKGEDTLHTSTDTNKTIQFCINTPHDAIEYTKDNIIFSHKTLLWIIGLDSKRNIIIQFPYNFMDRSINKDLLNIILKKNIPYIIFIEKKDVNHYSPTKQDLRILANYKNDFLLLNIILLDYIIFTKNGSLSLEKYSINPL